jgi:hypothetical protein
MYLSRYILEQIELNLALRFRAQSDPSDFAKQILDRFGVGYMSIFVEEVSPAALIESIKETGKTDSILYTDDGRRFVEDLYVEVRKLAPRSEPPAVTS